MFGDNFITGVIVGVCITAVLSLAYLVHMHKLLKDEYKEEVRNHRERAKAEAEFRFYDMLKNIHVTVEQRTVLENDSDIDWGPGEK